MSDKKQLLLEAQKFLAIKSVTLKETDLWTDEAFNSFTAHQFRELSIQSFANLVKVKTLRNEEIKEQNPVIALEYMLGVRLIVKNKEAASEEESVDVKLELQAMFSANYDAEKTLINDDAVDAFAEENGLFHIWPYWREYVQSMCNRVGVPPIPIAMRPGKVEIGEFTKVEDIDIPH